MSSMTAARQPLSASSPAEESRSPFVRLTDLIAGLAPGKPVINLSVGEPQHAIPDFVGPTLAAHLADFGRYPGNKGSDVFRQAVAAWLGRRFKLPRAVDADQALLKRVFSNLIQNALTHSARSVTVTLGARTDSGGTLFTVADDGVGIPPEYHDIIFRKFEQVKTPHIPRVRSSGLGLAFCKLVVEAHGGRIWVKSGSERQGSAFHFWLPEHPPAASAPIGSGLSA